MIVTSCQHTRSVTDPAGLPFDGCPQIAFMGRSNVGKSSLINRLLGSRGLARTSKTPGRTRAIQLFRVNEGFYFVDLPGYGYARVPRSMREEWRGLIESYLDGPRRPDLAVVLVDGRHPPTDLDRELVEWLRSRAIPARVVLTKTDKLPRSRRAAALERATDDLGLGAGLAPLPASTITGDGLQALWRVLDTVLVEGRRSPLPSDPVPRRAGSSHTRIIRPQPERPPTEPSRKRTRP